MKLKLKLHLSGGLRAILNHLPPEIKMEIEGPIPLRDVLVRAGINPLLIMMLTVDGSPGEKDRIIDRDAEIELIGPVAGG